MSFSQIKCDVPDCRESKSFLWRYFPEWHRESSIVLLLLKASIVGVLVFAMFVIEETNDFLFPHREGVGIARLTYDTVIAVVIFNLAAALFTIVYFPYQRRVGPIWVFVLSLLAWVGLMAYLVLADFVDGRLNVDTIPFDLWTVDHFLAGPVLAYVMPFAWMALLTCGWEILEASTTGLGDGESDVNRITDILVAWVGWWLIILIFSRHDIPWVSSRRACGNEGRYLTPLEDREANKAKRDMHHGENDLELV